MTLLKEQMGTLLTDQPPVDMELVKEYLLDDNKQLLKKVGEFVADANDRLKVTENKSSADEINKTLRDTILWYVQGDALLDDMCE